MAGFLMAWLVFCGALAVMASSPLWLDRVIVWFMRRFRLYLFPTAIRLAVSLERDRDEWHFEKHEARHKNIGTVWTANGSDGIRVTTPVGHWKPNWIERRIIQQAVDRTGVLQHLDRTLPQ